MKKILHLPFIRMFIQKFQILHSEKLTKVYKFYYNVINLYSYNDFIPTLIKEELKNITKLIKKTEKNKYL